MLGSVRLCEGQFQRVSPFIPHQFLELMMITFRVKPTESMRFSKPFS